jgi:outer membrane protein insertion porin family
MRYLISVFFLLALTAVFLSADEKTVAVRSLTLIHAGELSSGMEESITNEIKSRTYKSGNLNAIAERLRFAFQRYGYFKVIVHDPSFTVVNNATDPEIVDISVKVDEGDIYRLKDISFSKDAVFSPPELRTLFPIADGEIMNPDKIRQGLDGLRHLYLAKGYVNFSAVPETRIHEPEHTIAVVIGLDPGTREGSSSNR